MGDTTVSMVPSVVVVDRPATTANPRLRILELLLVLGVGFSGFLVSSAFHFRTDDALPHGYDNLRIIHALCTEFGALAVMFYVLYRQGRTWHALSLPPQAKDLLRALGVFVATSLYLFIIYFIIQKIAYSISGHWLTPKNLKAMFAVGVTILSVSFMIVNAFFEELLARAYLMTEVSTLGGSQAAAVSISTVFQASYHLYQGWLNATLVASTFLVFSLYYAKTRRLAPIVIAHATIDLIALLRFG